MSYPFPNLVFAVLGFYLRRDRVLGILPSPISSRTTTVFRPELTPWTSWTSTSRWGSIALLWQKEASDKSEISCKRAKCVCHFHWCQWKIMMFYITYLLAEWVLYKLLFSRGFYFREFREPDPRENFHFNSCLFIVMTTSEKSWN